MNEPGPGREPFEQEENIGLALALFITARAKGGDVEMRNGRVVIGDRLEDITQVSIEVAATTDSTTGTMRPVVAMMAR